MTSSLSCEATCLAPRLFEHLVRQFLTVLPGTSLPFAANLVRALVSVAVQATFDEEVSSGDMLNAWTEAAARRAVDVLARDPHLRDGLVTGDVDLAAVLEAADSRTAVSKRAFRVIKSHHQRLRTEVGVCPVTTSAQRTCNDVAVVMPHDSVDSALDTVAAPASWRHAIQDDHALQEYAAAATNIGARTWVQLGIDWCASQARAFFRNGGAMKLIRKEALRQHLKHSGVRMTVVDEEELVAQLLNDPDVCFQTNQLIRVLDVGSCGFLFAGCEGLAVTALDLCPQEHQSMVFQCDFLQLQVTEPGTSCVSTVSPLELPSGSRVEPHARFVAGTLRSLPSGSFDAIVLSLVLSYLPLPSQRGAMITKARALLRPSSHSLRQHPRRRGLLLIIETLSVDRQKASWRDRSSYLHQWVSTIEGLGFHLLRHNVLARSHALAFVTTQTPPDDRTPTLTSELHLRSERAAERVLSSDPSCVGTCEDRKSVV